jgi:hypothetical protein
MGNPAEGNDSTPGKASLPKPAPGVEHLVFKQAVSPGRADCAARPAR